jgi:hydrogenase/urease accessory protein HupE
MKFKLALLLLFLLVPQLASAHTALSGNLEGVITDNQIDLKFIFPEERKLDDKDKFNTYTQSALKFSTNNQACGLALVDFVTSIPTIVTFKVTCPVAIEKLKIDSTFFNEEGIIFNAQFDKEKVRQFYVFDEVQTSTELDFTPPDPYANQKALIKRASDFINMGIKHNYTGYDHILFIVALILAIRKLSTIIKTATAFTISHSITLLLTMYNVINISSKIVEPLIALSIVVVALLDIFKKRLPKSISYWQVAFVFGLIHGTGFSAALKELQIPKNEILLPLLSFNVGVELAQASIIFVGILILFLLRKLPNQDRLIRVGQAFVGCLGIVWFFERLLKI